jgi:hypothetical protein
METVLDNCLNVGAGNPAALLGFGVKFVTRKDAENLIHDGAKKKAAADSRVGGGS